MYYAGNIGMTVFNNDCRHILLCFQNNFYVKLFRRILPFHTNLCPGKQPGFLHLFRGNGVQNLQNRFTVAAYNSQCRRHFQPCHIRSGNPDSHGIFQNIAAHLYLCPHRFLSQNCPCLGRGISNCNRLRTPRCRRHFLFQNLQNLIMIHLFILILIIIVICIPLI